MFKFASNYILGALVTFAYASRVTSATGWPPEIDNKPKGNKRDDSHSPITICRDTGFSNCLAFEIVNDQCLNLTGAGGLDAYNKKISSSRIQDPHSICIFFRNFDCYTDGTDNNRIILRGGDYPDFTRVPGDHGLINFNDAASSIMCSSKH